MGDIYKCVEAFSALLFTEYHLVLGRKGVAINVQIGFDKKDCYHLMGLQYLVDRPELNRDRGEVFDDIKSRRIGKAKIESSDFYKKIEGRIYFLPSLELILDSNDTVFKYNEKLNSFSMIQADYIMKSNIEERNIFLFLSKESDDRYFCRSFFPQEKIDYTKNQASWKLLYKKKVNLYNNTEIILYDKLNK